MHRIGNLNAALLPLVMIVAAILLCSSATRSTSNQSYGHSKVPKELYDSIVHMDSVWEDAYNNCKLDQHELLISEDLEFYHDQGGLMTSKKALIEALKNNICGKVTRELQEGSIE